MIGIAQKLDVVVAEFDKLFTIQVIWIVYYLVDDELFHLREMRKEVQKVLLINHSYGTIRHRLDRVVRISIENYASFSS